MGLNGKILYFIRRDSVWGFRLWIMFHWNEFFKQFIVPMEKIVWIKSLVIGHRHFLFFSRWFSSLVWFRLKNYSCNSKILSIYSTLNKRYFIEMSKQTNFLNNNPQFIVPINKEDWIKSLIGHRYFLQSWFILFCFSFDSSHLKIRKI